MTTRLVDCIVIDTMASVLPGANENSGEDISQFLRYCKTLHRETGALIILIAHVGKSADKGIRGWSGSRAAADATLEVTRNGDFRAVETTKLKDSVDGQTFSFKLKTVITGLTEDGEESSCVVEHTQTHGPSANWKPTGGDQKIVWKALEELSSGGSAVPKDEIVDLILKRNTFETVGLRTRRRNNLITCLDKMIEAQHLHNDDGKVSFTRVKVTDGDYLE